MFKSIRFPLLFIVLFLLTGAGAGDFSSARAGAGEVQPALYLPVLPNQFRIGFGTVTGKVIDARSDPNTNDAVPLPNVLVCPLGQYGCTLTDAQGRYTISNLSSGWHRVQASPQTFYEPLIQYADIQADQTTILNFALSPVLEQGQMRIVLTWDVTESWFSFPTADGVFVIDNDLDANLWVPMDPSPVRVYWDARQNCETNEIPFACLEYDVEQGFGPETILIQQQLLGTYHYAVLNYGAAEANAYGYPNVVPPLSELSARVQIYDFKGLLVEYRVEDAAGDGLWWHVFDIDTLSGQGVPLLVNTLTNEPPVPLMQAQTLGDLNFLLK